MTDSQTSICPPSDADLLKEFCELGLEPAFQALVEKHLGLVLGAATRRTGNRSLAEEVAQSVFAILARKAASLRGRVSLAGWLYRTT